MSQALDEQVPMSLSMTGATIGEQVTEAKIQLYRIIIISELTL